MLGIGELIVGIVAVTATVYFVGLVVRFLKKNS
jgi:hypothetical protein